MHASRARAIDAVRTAARVAVAAGALLTAAPFISPQTAGAVESNATAPWRGGFADVVQKVRPAVFSITVKIVEETHGQSKPRNGASGGSGFFVSPDGYAVTNAHVVRPEHVTTLSTQIRMPDGDTYDAEVIGADPQTDVALIKVKGRTDFPFVSFADAPPRVGDWVIAIGSPFGLDGTVTTGIVSAEGRDIGYGPYNDFIQIDAPTNQGSSGGPTFDLAGNVIGVNTALWRTPGATGFIGIAFAIPADTVKSIIAEIKENGSVTRGWLGVEVDAVTPEIAVRFGLTRARGALVRTRPGGKAASNAALDPGDVITSLNGEPVRDFRALARITAGMRPGTQVELGVLRRGEAKTVALRLGKLPDGPVQEAGATGSPTSARKRAQ
ncbi:MAG: trypsin-like peptidase domain-containing protein [Hyphomicrobiales bacterium]|nr:trypsin-like peptidase domain-containing protein [Hyphomicrobiales bacterium]MBV9429780.1 trypsin-like peptidase domain-containing protein [Bradyrhizobiaceae bacterium]